MGIMLLGHPRVSVAQLARDNGQWRAAHDQSASIGMTQNVKTDRRNNAGSVACIPHESNLVAAAPGSPILSDKNQLELRLSATAAAKSFCPSSVKKICRDFPDFERGMFTVAAIASKSPTRISASSP